MAKSLICMLLAVGLLASNAFARPDEAPADAPPKVTEADQVEFTQKNIAAQMKELEERMFRLGELAREMEPGDSAKLLMAVRRAREQLIIEQMKDTLELLARKDLPKAADEQKKVIIKLEELKQLLLATDSDLQMQLEQLKKIEAALKKIAELEKQQKAQRDETGKLADAQQQNKPVDPSALNSTKQQQDQTKKGTESLEKSIGDLGQRAGAAPAALAEAGKAMGGASGSLESAKPSDAVPSQEKALEDLDKAKQELEEQKKKLQEEIERQVRKQVIANLTEMLDRQKQVRESTMMLSSQASSQDREALLRVRQLGPAEQRIATIGAQTVHLINETDFSVTLPAALEEIERQCLTVTGNLQSGLAGAQVIESEKQIERDLADLLETFKELSRSTNQKSECKGCKGDKNKLLAELKVLRMMQTRVNRQTTDVDLKRSGVDVAALSPALKGLITDVRTEQERVQDATDKLHHSTCPDCMKLN